jgi:hypothetical protein
MGEDAVDDGGAVVERKIFDQDRQRASNELSLPAQIEHLERRRFSPLAFRALSSARIANDPPFFLAPLCRVLLPLVFAIGSVAGAHQIREKRRRTVLAQFF